MPVIRCKLHLFDDDDGGRAAVGFPKVSSAFEKGDEVAAVRWI